MVWRSRREVDGRTAQSVYERRILILRVCDDDFIVCSKKQRHDFTLREERFARAGYAEYKAIAVDEVFPVGNDKVVANGVHAAVCPAHIHDFMGAERHEYRHALGS